MKLEESGSSLINVPTQYQSVILSLTYGFGTNIQQRDCLQYRIYVARVDKGLGQCVDGVAL